MVAHVNASEELQNMFSRVLKHFKTIKAKTKLTQAFGFGLLWV